jgi:hypothetical protein
LHICHQEERNEESVEVREVEDKLEEMGCYEENHSMAWGKPQQTE